MRNINQSIFCIIALIIGMASHTYAQTIGPTYPIAERDMLEDIENYLKEKQRTGELMQLQMEAGNRIIANIERPKSASTLPVAKENRISHLDPSFKVDRTVRDHEGNVIALAGTLVNPLDYVQLSTYLLFIDGTDQKQVVIADAMVDHYKGNVKLILTNGSPIELGKKRGYPVFFDQGGALVRKLKLRALPSLITQEGKLLRIDEIAVP